MLVAELLRDTISLTIKLHEPRLPRGNWYALPLAPGAFRTVAWPARAVAVA